MWVNLLIYLLWSHVLPVQVLMKFLKVKHLIKPKHRMNMDNAPTLLLEIVFERTGALNKGGHVGSVDGTRYHCYNQRTSKSILHRVFTTPRADVAVESSPTICDAITLYALSSLLHWMDFPMHTAEWWHSSGCWQQVLVPRRSKRWRVQARVSGGRNPPPP